MWGRCLVGCTTQKHAQSVGPIRMCTPHPPFTLFKRQDLGALLRLLVEDGLDDCLRTEFDEQFFVRQSEARLLNCRLDIVLNVVERSSAGLFSLVDFHELKRVVPLDGMADLADGNRKESLVDSLVGDAPL